MPHVAKGIASRHNSLRLTMRRASPHDTTALASRCEGHRLVLLSNKHNESIICPRYCHVLVLGIRSANKYYIQAFVLGTTELGANNGQKETLQSLSETEGFTDLTISFCSVLLPKGWYRNLKT